MSVSSMTGFARTEGNEAFCVWAWEVKSVNGKGLDVRVRLPRGFDGLEPLVRPQVSKLFKRGNIAVNLELSWSKPQAGMVVNKDVLAQVVEAIKQVQLAIADATPPRVDGILALRGVLEQVDFEPGQDEQQNLERVLLLGLEQALEQLKESRDGEGIRLGSVLHDQLADMENLWDQISKRAALQPKSIVERLARQVDVLVQDLGNIDPERLAQEAALLMTKADVQEELDRLMAHMEAARNLLAEGVPVGRRLDFLCQEFNREANTLCAKSADTHMTRAGLELKAVIEQFREQVQNIE